MVSCNQIVNKIRRLSGHFFIYDAVCYIASLVNIFLVIPATYLFHKKDEDESLSFAK